MMTPDQGDGTQGFSTAFRGYDPDEVEAHMAAAREREEELTASLQELTAERRRLERELDRTTADRDRLAEENARLDRDLARTLGELDATRAALPEIEDLQQRLTDLTAAYERRIKGLDVLLPYAARVAAGATSTDHAGTPTPSGADPSSADRDDASEEVEEAAGPSEGDTLPTQTPSG